MSDNLKNKTLDAIIWSATERFGLQGIQFVVSIILARLLLPEDFGLIAMLAIFIAIADAFINSGFGQALIQKKGATHADECSIFYFNVVLGFLVAALLSLAAPWIADFYNQPQLILMIYALSFNLILSALGLVQVTLLSKHLNFKVKQKVSLISAVGSGTIGVTMALKGFGVWSLVTMQVSDTLFRTSLLWLFNTWRPSWTFSFNALRSMFVFGSRIFLVGLLNAFFVNIYSLVIARLFSPMALGFYTRAESLQKLPVMSIAGVINQVTFPVFSSIQDNKPRLKRALSEALSMMELIVFPMMVGLAIVAKPLVLVLLTEKWLPIVPYLQLFCVIGVLYPIQLINLSVLNAQGRSDLFLRLQIIQYILIIITILITYRWGITAMIYGKITCSFIACYLCSYYTQKILGYSIIEQVKDLIPTLALSGLMGLGVYALKYTLINDELTLMIAQIVTGIVIYSSMCYFFRISSFMKITRLIKTRVGI
ncbi:lipopolysaccharide biosynthesis protein [Gammaproteobacteria bacterium]|nr:lipopolysaccharide biosynthesis protein [Gammaproteobacteria bacterium]